MQSIADHMGTVAGGEGMPVEAVELSPEQAEEQRRQQEEQRAKDMARLDALGQSLARTRAEAIAARSASGVEDDWLEDEEFYQGIDDANRGEHRSLWRTKPPGQGTAQQQTTTRSTVFPNITRPYTDAAAARIADMLLPTDDRAWSLKPTPIPELADAAKGVYSRQDLQAVAAQNPGQPELAQQELVNATRAALEEIAQAKASADKAQTRIEDWHVESQWHAQVRLVIEDAARIGTGVLKGPVPMRKTRVIWREGSMQIIQEIKPGSKWVDVWNIYPDAACGENIHNGSYMWERDGITRKQLRELIGQEGYIKEQIEQCLTEGPMRATAEYKPTPDEWSRPEQKDKYEIWYFHGTAEREDLEVAGCDCEGVTDPHAPAMVVMVNNRVIKAALNPLDTGEFPYDVMIWQRRAGFWAGVGVARQIRTPQRIVTAATRNLMDNAGLAAGPMIVFRQGVVSPADGLAPGIAPRRVWYIAENAEEIDDATKAIGQIKVDMLVDELLKIIQLGLKLAEDVTGLPMLLQGQMGKAPDTLGGMQMLSNNASAVLRRLARTFDDRVTEPHVRRYYTWLLLDPSVPDDEKGDYCIDARGSSALVERDLQNQMISQMGNLILDPRFGKDPKKWMDEYLKSQRLDPERFAYDDEQWQGIVENMAKGPQDPRMAVAQLQAQSKEAITKLQGQIDGQLLAIEKHFESAENERNRSVEIAMAQLENLAKGAELTNESRNVLAGIRQKLADTVIKTNTQKQLSREGAMRQAMKPPTEPAGRARPGQAFQH